MLLGEDTEVISEVIDRRQDVPMTRRRLAPILVAITSIALGFALTAPGVATWDSLPHLDRSRWLVHMLGLPSSRGEGSPKENGSHAGSGHAGNGHANNGHSENGK